MGQRITEEEIKSIEDIRRDYQDTAMKLGQIEFQINDLEAEAGRLLDLYQEGKEKEKEIADSFVAKYGQGTLNPTTWEFEKK